MTVCVIALTSCSSSGECSVDLDCDDGDECTEDRCRLEHCSHLSTPWCCRVDSDCTEPDRNICHADIDRCVQCLSDDDCPDELICNPASFTCETEIVVPGQACSGDDQCETGWCLTEATTGFPGGFCGQECTLAEDCSSGVCIEIAPGKKTCLAGCAGGEACRSAYMCLWAGPGQAGCFPKCSSDAECPTVGACNPWVGMCGPTGAGADNGAACLADQDCKGFCVTEQTNGAPGGVCVSLCTAERTSCPQEDECVVLFSPFLFTQSVCLPGYQPPAVCRDNYVPMVAFDIANELPLGVCQPACRPGACQAANCNIDTGLCNSQPGGPGETGDVCTVHEDCRGLCMNFWPGGYCSSPCHVTDPICQAGGSCMNLGVHWSCAADCQTDQDCRNDEGYICHPDQKVCVSP